jgi:hypothetical protein
MGLRECSCFAQSCWLAEREQTSEEQGSGYQRGPRLPCREPCCHDARWWEHIDCILDGPGCIESHPHML